MLLRVNPVIVSCEENPLALAAVFGLNDESFSFTLVKLLSKLLIVAG